MLLEGYFSSENDNQKTKFVIFEKKKFDILRHIKICQDKHTVKKKLHHE